MPPSEDYSACSLGWHTNLSRLAPTVPGADKCIQVPAVSLKLRIVPVAIGPDYAAKEIVLLRPSVQSNSVKLR